MCSVEAPCSFFYKLISGLLEKVFWYLFKNVYLKKFSVPVLAEKPKISFQKYLAFSAFKIKLSWFAMVALRIQASQIYGTSNAFKK